MIARDEPAVGDRYALPSGRVVRIESRRSTITGDWCGCVYLNSDGQPIRSTLLRDGATLKLDFLIERCRRVE